MVIILATGGDGVVYLGTADGHVFVKMNASKQWELRGRVGIRTDAVVSRLVRDPNKTGAMFAAIWYQQPGAGGGVFRSDDEGRNWTLLGLKDEAVRALESSDQAGQPLIAGTRTGVFRSSDSGNTWERISPEGDPELRNIDSLAFDPRDANIIYAGTYHLPWKTVDAGKHWNSINTGLIDDSDIMSLRVDARNPDRLFLSACSGIYRSENQGGLWTKLQGIPYAARRTHSIVQDLQDSQTLYAGTTEGLWVTRDGGESWERATPEAWVINTVAVVPGVGDGKERVLIGTESRGVLASEDAGKIFAEQNDGFAHQVIRQLIGDPHDPTHLAMMMESNGGILWESWNGGGAWIPLTPPQQENKKVLLFAPETAETLYASPWGWMVRLSTGRVWFLNERLAKWSEWKMRLPAATTSVPASPKQVRTTTQRAVPKTLTPVGSAFGFSAETAFVPTKEGLLRCDLAGSCARLKAFGRGGNISAIHVSPEGANLLTVVDGKLAISTDGGQSAVWRDLPSASEGVLWVDLVQEAAGQSVAVIIGTLKGMFASDDDGANWKRVGQGLPSGEVEMVRRGKGFMAASLREGGFFVSRDNGQTWTRAVQDAERGRFTGMVETIPGSLLIGSQSEGVLRWENKLNKK
jgi:photosystem II stability/assembly factor-like uncharacterized protein